MTVTSKQHALSPEQREHFVEHGWVKIPGGVPKENVDLFTKDIWIRLGYDKDDKSTWKEERFRTPRHREMPWDEFAPKGYSAICEIIGGEDRIDPKIFGQAGDSLITNFGKDEYRDMHIQPRDLDNWHVDGNWFRHFLDSGEQSLLIVILFNDVIHRAGGTWICEDGLDHIIKWLHDRPEGALWEEMFGSKSPAQAGIKNCEKFIECTGQAGDIFICHGFMPHSASKNHLRVPRFITSPKVVLKEPFNLNRENPDEYSLVELKTLRSLGVSSLPNWKIKGERARFPPDSNKKKDARLPLELERLKAHYAKLGRMPESMHLNGVVLPDYAGKGQN